MPRLRANANSSQALGGSMRTVAAGEDRTSGWTTTAGSTLEGFIEWVRCRGPGATPLA